MKQTNLLNYRLGMSRSGIAKPLGFVAACLALLFVFGLQMASAQTMSEMGELQADHTIKLIKGEVQFLEQEVKYPQGNVNTEKNGQLIAYYNNVIDLFSDGENMKDALMNVGPANTAQGNYSNSSTSFAGLSQNNSEAIIRPTDTEYKVLGGLVNQLDLNDSDDSDLIAIFNLLRTLKNQ